MSEPPILSILYTSRLSQLSNEHNRRKIKNYDTWKIPYITSLRFWGEAGEYMINVNSCCKQTKNPFQSQAHHKIFSLVLTAMPHPARNLTPIWAE